MGLKIVRLEYVHSKEDGIPDRRRSYVFQAFLKPNGELSIDGYSAVSRLCKVIKSEPTTFGRHEGLLILTSEGWMLACDGSDHQCMNRLEARRLVEGDYVTIAEDDGVERLFKVVSVRDAEVQVLAS